MKNFRRDIEDSLNSLCYETELNSRLQTLNEILNIVCSPDIHKILDIVEDAITQTTDKLNDLMKVA
jgi:hypothetical protein